MLQLGNPVLKEKGCPLRTAFFDCGGIKIDKALCRLVGVLISFLNNHRKPAVCGFVIVRAVFLRKSRLS